MARLGQGGWVALDELDWLEGVERGCQDGWVAMDAGEEDDDDDDDDDNIDEYDDREDADVGQFVFGVRRADRVGTVTLFSSSYSDLTSVITSEMIRMACKNHVILTNSTIYRYFL